MNNTAFILFIICVYLTVTFADNKCSRPEELKLKEEACWKTEVEVVDRFVQTSKSVFNLAKKKLGIAVEEEAETKKCQYYLCILRQLHMLNAHDYPAYDSIRQWIEKNVIYYQALTLFERLDRCNLALTNATLEERMFIAAEVDLESDSEEKSNKDEKQSTCEIATEFIDCLSNEKDCPVFEFP